MTEYKITLENPPDGYEAEACIRVPLVGETILSGVNTVEQVGLKRYDTFVTYPVLTKKKSWAEANPDFEVGAVYVREDPHASWCPYLIETDGPIELNRSREVSTSSAYCDWFIKEYPHRKVINADGSMVDGDIEWVSVGGYEVTKADLRALHPCDYCDTCEW